MNVLHTRPTQFQAGHHIEFGDSTWSNGVEKSVRLRVTNRNGGFSTGSPEVAMWTLLEMLEASLVYGGITAKQVLDVVSKTLP